MSADVLDSWPVTPAAQLYAQWRPGPWPYPAQWPGHVHSALIRDWQTLVASASGEAGAAARVVAQLQARGVNLQESQPDQLQPAAWLALQDAVLEHGFAADAAAFAAALRALFAERTPRLARLALRALPAAPAVQRAAQAAAQLLPGPPPHVAVTDRGLVLRFADLDLYCQATFAVWATAQAEAGWALLRPGQPVTVQTGGPLVLGLAVG